MTDYVYSGVAPTCSTLSCSTMFTKVSPVTPDGSPEPLFMAILANMAILCSQNLMTRQHHCSWQFCVRNTWWLANTTVRGSSLFATPDDSPTPLFIAVFCSQQLMTRQHHCWWHFFVHNTWWFGNTTGHSKSLLTIPDDSPTLLFMAVLCS